MFNGSRRCLELPESSNFGHGAVYDTLCNARNFCTNKAIF